ncbi:MAG: terminase small subunit [Opitutaceae bacterium]
MAKKRTKKLMRAENRLNERQKRFAAEYLIDFNGMQAAIRAGYSARSASTHATNLLKIPLLREYMEILQRGDVRVLRLSRREVLKQLYYVATRDVLEFVDDTGELLPINKLPDRARAAVDGFKQTVTVDPETGERTITTQLKLSPKAAAIDMAMKHKGLFAPDKSSVRVEVSPWDKLCEQPIDVDVVEQRVMAPLLMERDEKAL